MKTPISTRLAKILSTGWRLEYYAPNEPEGNLWVISDNQGVDKGVGDTLDLCISNALKEMKNKKND